MAQAAAELDDSTLSAAKSGNADDIALIEQQVNPALNELLEHYEPVSKLENIPYDTLNDRFTIKVKEALPDLNAACAHAYAAKDLTSDTPTMALVSETHIPYRQQAIDALRGNMHPHLINLRDAGPVKLSHTDELRQVLFVDQPQGQRLSDMIGKGKRFQERKVIDQLLAPLIEALGFLYEKGISHGRINPREVFIKEKLVLNECVSEPTGFGQDPLFEPVERLLAEPEARGAATDKTDAYALGMLAFEAMFGLEEFRRMPVESLIRTLMEKGAYHAYAVNQEFSETIADFFRGTLTENKQERWGIDQLRSWIGGKRFNLIMPSLPKESTRPYEFNERDYFSRRALANGIYQAWPNAAKQIRQGKLDRWLEMSVHDSESAEVVDRIIRSFGGEFGTGEKINNEMLSRIIVVLDPTGPIRLQSVSVNVDGIGVAMSHYFQQRDNHRVKQLLEIIDADLPTYWSEQCEMEKTTATSNMLWTLQRIRSHIKIQGHGFGLERLVYDLNPSLPCQNPMVLPYHATDIGEALTILDNIAKTNAAEHSLADRHLSAFFASKIELGKEIKFHQLAKVPKLREHPELICLRIISMAQDKNGRRKLVGLATWAAMRVDRLLSKVHSRKLRRKIRENLLLAAKSGMVSRVLAVLVENDLTKDDHLGFSRANAIYLKNEAKIKALRNNQSIEKNSQELGGRMAVFLAYLILGVVVYNVVDKHFM